MKLTNQKRASSIAMLFTVIIIILSVLLMIAYFGNIAALMGYTTAMWVALMLAIAMYRLGGYHFMDIEINNREADIKYYRIFPVGRTYKRVKIKGEQLHKIKIHNGFLGFAANLQLFVNTGKGRAKYPFIGLGAVSAADRKKIGEALQKIK